MLLGFGYSPKAGGNDVICRIYLATLMSPRSHKKNEVFTLRLFTILQHLAVCKTVLQNIMCLQQLECVFCKGQGHQNRALALFCNSLVASLSERRLA